MVDQKVNYFLGQPFTVQADNDNYTKILNDVFDRSFLRLLKNIGENSLNCGIGWIFLHYDENGEFTFRRFKPYEVIAGWADDEHTRLDYAIRIYEIIDDTHRKEEVVKKVEVYHSDGISRFVFDGARLKRDSAHPPLEPYFTVNDQGYNWHKIPLIPFKYNNKEIPLINNVKSLQDGLNLVVSNFQNNMEEDSRNTILVIVNYDGAGLGEFRKNLSTFGAIKVRSDEGGGGVESLQVEVNGENYQKIIKIFKDAIIENAFGFDAKDERMLGSPNQMNIQSAYSDIDLDTNRIETEYQASFENLIYFINLHLAHVGKGDFDNEDVQIIFNREMLVSETDKINNIKNSLGIISHETALGIHPWVDDTQAEQQKLEAERQADLQQMMQYDSNSNALVTNNVKTAVPARR
jgi:SPP1 family phage portal protein